MAEILPSILSADFAHLADQVRALESAGARILHVDVMDGHFVPNLTIGPPVVASLRKATKMKLDVHLMIEDPDRFAPRFIEAGADLVSVHQEACRNLDRTMRMVRDEGARVGVVINPGTPVDTLDDVLELADYVLVMSVNPGFGGQKFIPNALEKIKRLIAKRNERGLDFSIEIDGGVTRDNVAEIVRAGAKWVVAGSAVFSGGDPARGFEELQREARVAEMVRA